MNLNRIQVLGIVIAVGSFLGTSTTQLATLFGQSGATYIVAALTLITGSLGVALASIGGQSSLVQQVQAMPGIEKIQVNAQANPTLASLAVDPSQNKIEIAPGAEQAVAKTATQ